MAQAEIAAAEAQPVGTIQTPFDFYLRTSQPRANFLAWHSPVISVPAHGVIVGHRASHAHAEDFLQTLASIQGPMGIARVARRYDETLFPLRKKAGLQKVIGGDEAVDAGQAHFFYQAVLQVSNNRSMRPLACGLWAAIHSIPSSWSARPKCERTFSPRNCSRNSMASDLRKMLFLSV